jgi:hypothetical protein
MIDAGRLLKDLQALLRTLEDDLRERVTSVPDLDAPLRSEYETSFQKGRTGQAYEEWREDALTQAAVAWILGCVFVRFLEDNGLIETPQLSGPGERRQRALDQHELYFQASDRRTHSDRDYLLYVFDETEKLPAAREVFDRKHNPLWSLGISGDGATQLLRFWQRVDPDTGAVAFDFTDPDWNTRFLGDLYQDLSESARKKYALLQTPEFVEEFILDRTLTPAINEFGFREVRLIDPTCGSGHFLLGAFHRLFDLWLTHEPGVNSRELAQRALSQVYGVDINPFAVAIAKFRLLVAALRVSEVQRLADAPRLHLNLAVGDSLLHGKIFGSIVGTQRTLSSFEDPLEYAYKTEDLPRLNAILGMQYHVVVGNPPYVLARDRVLNHTYRTMYPSCSGKYSLVVPFVQRCFNLGIDMVESVASGFVGVIIANSFMKRAFGKKLIETYLPTVDLTHIVDTSGAYLPGHGTPTVILFGRSRPPVGASIRTVLGIQGEPSVPEDPARGIVWRAITAQIDQSRSESDWVSSDDLPRSHFRRHPWSTSGGGAADVQQVIEMAGFQALATVADVVGGIGAVTAEDDAYAGTKEQLQRRGVDPSSLSPFIEGETLRDWMMARDRAAIFPYDSHFVPRCTAGVAKCLWPFRTSLENRIWFRKPHKERDLQWFEYAFLSKNVRGPVITFAFVATHNHFVLDRGGKIFKQSAPIIKLPPEATEEDHLALLGLLNSSTACFWMKQVFHNKGGGGIGGGLASEEWEQFYEFTGTGLNRFPVPGRSVVPLGRKLDALGQRLLASSPGSWGSGTPDAVKSLGRIRPDLEAIQEQMIALQEELDWHCYSLYGLTETPLTCEADPPPIALGERAFEILLAREIESGETETTWFERHRSTPKTAIPDHWPLQYRKLVEQRIRLIQSDRDIALIERPECKRRWNSEPWDSQLSTALRAWMASRLEELPAWSSRLLTTVGRLSDLAAQDLDFTRVATCYRGHPDFDMLTLVAELVDEQAVPFLPELRFKAAGLRKHGIWKSTWSLQRKEDAGELSEKDAKKIPVPPKYTSSDFHTATIWRLRGRLDVPKERFLSFPHCERESDPTLVIGWAGWNRLEQSQAIAAYYLEMKEKEGWTAERLTPLLAGLQELNPWVKQWHNELEPAHGVRMGDYFADFVETEARDLEVTLTDIETWTPRSTPQALRKRKKELKT